MSLRTKLSKTIDVLLRVPPLFIIDELLRIGLGLPQYDTSKVFSQETEEAESGNGFQTNYFTNIDSQFYKLLFITFMKFIISCIGCSASLCVFLLKKKHLVIVYKFIVSVGIVFVSYWLNVSTMKAVIVASAVSSTSVLEDILSLNIKTLFEDGDGCGWIILQNYLMQSLLAVSFSFFHLGPRYSFSQKLLPLSFLAPSTLALLPMSSKILHHAPVFAALLPLALVKFVIWSSALTVVQTIVNGYQHARTYISNFGVSTLMESEWIRLNVPCVLRTFWILRVLEHAASIFADWWKNSQGIALVGPSNSSFYLANYPFESFPSPLLIIKSLLITGCETLTAVLGMTSVISYICHYIGCIFQWVLLTDEDDDKSIGNVSAILFYILALQTGLTSLEPEKRFIRLCRNFCLLFTAVLHFIHNLVNPILMSLSASHNPYVHRHVRALLVCAFLIFYPLTLVIYLWWYHSISTWLLAVSAFSAEVVVKVIVSLLIYSLFLIDAYRSTFWEKFDDYVYYIRAFGNTVDFCFGIFLFLNGAWILFFESGGAIRALMMCIHAYFNIWCEARQGWSVFMKRRTAVNKIECLPEATYRQLLDLDDVCAICYQEMKSAKITKCQHFFHGVCLRKWLYVQDRCPLCHDVLYKVDSESKDRTVVREDQAPLIQNNNAEALNQNSSAVDQIQL